MHHSWAWGHDRVVDIDSTKQVRELRKLDSSKQIKKWFLESVDKLQDKIPIVSQHIPEINPLNHQESETSYASVIQNNGMHIKNQEIQQRCK